MDVDGEGVVVVISEVCIVVCVDICSVVAVIVNSSSAVSVVSEFDSVVGSSVIEVVDSSVLVVHPVVTPSTMIHIWLNAKYPKGKTSPTIVIICNYLWILIHKEFMHKYKANCIAHKPGYHCLWIFPNYQ